MRFSNFGVRFYNLGVRFGNFGVKFSNSLPRSPMVQDQGSDCAQFASFTKGGRPVEKNCTPETFLMRWTRS
ncbi:BQ5605_C007g04846 [Microbotryum silenes-dioicae]|uniref:BQ5605_C007g04846 protein n=1 Tax=Microbotryum silenes-dioicae TaxID=796604 RepID=A0A2X0MBC5_9BASI|nr:BQ5605_C007g04846 [Microbotryum silenes-dioicae]